MNIINICGPGELIVIIWLSVVASCADQWNDYQSSPWPGLVQPGHVNIWYTQWVATLPSRVNITPEYLSFRPTDSRATGASLLYNQSVKLSAISLPMSSLYEVGSRPSSSCHSVLLISTQSSSEKQIIFPLRQPPSHLSHPREITNYTNGTLAS